MAKRVERVGINNIFQQNPISCKTFQLNQIMAVNTYVDCKIVCKILKSNSNKKLVVNLSTLEFVGIFILVKRLSLLTFLTQFYLFFKVQFKVINKIYQTIINLYVLFCKIFVFWSYKLRFNLSVENIKNKNQD